MSEATDIVFEPLPMRKRTLAAYSANQYRIKDSEGQVVMIEANTAYEAFKASGFKSAVKIERLSSIMQPILGKDKFTDEHVSDVKTPSEEPTAPDALEEFKRRKTPIISADELDILMRRLESTADLMPQIAEMQFTDMAKTVPVPAPAPYTDAVLPEGMVPGPTGMDVHGDGFDEIIPANIGAKPVAIKADAASQPEVSTVEEQNIQASMPDMPDKELSQEEIEKLLNG